MLCKQADRSRFDSPVQPVAHVSYEEEGKKPDSPAACGCIGICLVSLPTWHSHASADHTSVPQAPLASLALSAVSVWGTLGSGGWKTTSSPGFGNKRQKVLCLSAAAWQMKSSRLCFMAASGKCLCQTSYPMLV